MGVSEYYLFTNFRVVLIRKPSTIILYRKAFKNVLMFKVYVLNDLL